MWDTKKDPDLAFYKHSVACVWVITILLTVYFPCCQCYRANTNDLEVSYTLFLVYYNQLLITWGLSIYSLNCFLFPTVGWNMALSLELNLLKLSSQCPSVNNENKERQNSNCKCNTDLTQDKRFDQSSVGIGFCCLCDTF